MLCPKCNSRIILTKKRTNTRWCQRCGYEGSPEEFEGEERTKTVELACPKCGTKAVLTKKRTSTRWCRRCGYEGPAGEFERKEKEIEAAYEVESPLEIEDNMGGNINEH
jgi:DNA-directed RNA polymerase subunit M/transcription elongation factor TFIIS